MSVTGFFVEVTRLNSLPLVSVSDFAGSAYGRSSVAPRIPFGSPAGVRMIAPPGLSLDWFAPLPQPTRASRATTAKRTAAFLDRLTTGLTGDRCRAFPPDTLREPFGQLPYAARARTGLQYFDQRRTHDHRIRVRRDARGLVRIRNTEADPDGQGGGGLGPGDQRCGQIGHLLTRTGDAHHGGRIDEPATGRRGERDPLVGRRGRDQEHLVQLVLVRRGDPLGALFGDLVGRDQPRSPGGCQVP